MSNRLTPIDGPFEPEAAKILQNYPKRDGYILQLFRVFANSVRFLKKGTVNLLDRDSPITMREREIIILRVCANNDCEYEWGVHVAGFSEHVGLIAQQVTATRHGDSAADCWSAREKTLLGVVDELCRTGTLTDPLLEAFQSNWNTAEQLEILALCGNYHTICFVANTARLPLESFAAPFPEPV